ncbi:MAG: chromosome segregation protein SMC, partial [Magnetococcales bacterium]|nr:chromosome segregation protein SMC [Magnetococcales bacterium]
HADSGERSGILEQITGTEIYSHISRRVHERRREEQRKRETLEGVLVGIRLLADEEERRLELDQALGILTDEALRNRMGEIEGGVRWWATLGRLEEELRGLSGRKEAWERRWQAFAPEREALRRAMLALEAMVRHGGLGLLREAQERDRSGREALMAQWPGG